MDNVEEVTNDFIEYAKELNENREYPVTPMELIYRVGCIPKGITPVVGLPYLSVQDQFEVIENLKNKLYKEEIK